MNKGVVYALWDYEAQNNDELSFHEGDAITILRRKDDNETEWWWARLNDKEGYVPKNLLGVSSVTLSLLFFTCNWSREQKMDLQSESLCAPFTALWSGVKQIILILSGLCAIVNK